MRSRKYNLNRGRACIIKLTETIIELEQKLERMLTEIAELKMHVYALEQQNELLLARVYKDQKGEQGYHSLQKLYDEGFHVCPAQFGGIRSEGKDCLFCLAFFKKRTPGMTELKD